MKKAVQFGAGNIGRGFTGELFSESGYEVVFIDVIPEIVEALNRERAYTITIAAEPEERIRVENVRAVNGRDVGTVAREVAGADIACTAVGVNVLASVAGPIARGLQERFARSETGQPLNVIVCENMRNAAGALRDMVLEKLPGEHRAEIAPLTGFVQAVVGRMVPVRTDEERREDPVGIRVEPYKKLPVDLDAIIGDPPEIEGVQYRNNFQAYIDQKLFAHNAGHASAAYFGALKGYDYVWQAVEDSWVREKTLGVMQETGRALISRYAMDAQDLWAHVDDLLRRFANRKLGDTVARVGGDPMRKLARDDRLIGGGIFCLEQGVEPDSVALAAAAGLRYNNPDDASAVRMQNLIKEIGVTGALEQIAGISSDSEFGKRVLVRYAALA